MDVTLKVKRPLCVLDGTVTAFDGVPSIVSQAEIVWW